jgi:hypothetical protein
MPKRAKALLRRLADPFGRSRSSSPNPKDTDESSDRKAERSLLANSKLDQPATTAPHVSRGPSPSTTHKANVRTPQTVRSPDATAIDKQSGSNYSHSEKVDDQSHRKLEASSPGEFGRRQTTASNHPSEATTIDASGTRAAASQVSSGPSPSTSHTANVRTPKILMPTDTTATNKHHRSTSSHSEQLSDESHPKLEASPGEPDHRLVTTSRDHSDKTATIDASGARAADSTSNVTNPYAVIMGTDPATTPPASSKAKSALGVFLKGLKRTLEVVKESSDMMPPLKTAAAAILGIWNVTEVCLRLRSLP